MAMKGTLTIFMLVAALLMQPARADLATLQQLVDHGDYDSAYKLGQSMLNEHGGQIDFDFMLGVAAVNSDHPSEAVFAFSRVLIARPDHFEASLLLGDAYLRIGQQDQARKAWEDLASQPSGTFGDQARQRLARLHSNTAGTRSVTRGLSAFAALHIGHDSNVNSSTAEDQPIIASPATIVLVDTSAQETSDSFAELNLGVGGRGVFGSNSFSASLESDLKKNSEASQFDTSRYTVTGTYGFQTSGFRFRLPLYYRQLNLDGADYLNYVAAAIGFEGRVGTAHWLGLSAESGRFTYDALPERDNNTSLAALSWTYEGTGAWQRAELRLYGGRASPADKIVDIAGTPTNVEYLGRQFNGIAMSNRIALNERHHVLVKLLYEASEYDDLDPVYLDVREETYSQFALAWHWMFRKQTTFQLDASSTRIDTDMALYAYDRAVFRIGLRYEL